MTDFLSLCEKLDILRFDQPILLKTTPNKSTYSYTTTFYDPKIKMESSDSHMLKFGSKMADISPYLPLTGIKSIEITKNCGSNQIKQWLVLKLLYLAGKAIPAAVIADKLGISVASMKGYLLIPYKYVQKQNDKPYLYKYIGPVFYHFALPGEGTHWSVEQIRTTLKVMLDSYNQQLYNDNDAKFITGCDRHFKNNGTLTGKQLLRLHNVYYKYL